MYCYNLKTGTLHMKGCCAHSTPYLAHGRIFETEKDAFDFAGQKIHWCKICQKKREEKLKEGNL